MELGSRVKISSEGSSLGRGVVDGLGNGLANDLESEGRGLDNLAYCHKVMHDKTYIYRFHRFQLAIQRYIDSFVVWFCGAEQRVLSVVQLDCERS